MYYLYKYNHNYNNILNIHISFYLYYIYIYCILLLFLRYLRNKCTYYFQYLIPNYYNFLYILFHYYYPLYIFHTHRGKSNIHFHQKKYQNNNFCILDYFFHLIHIRCIHFRNKCNFYLNQRHNWSSNLYILYFSFYYHIYILNILLGNLCNYDFHFLYIQNSNCRNSTRFHFLNKLHNILHKYRHNNIRYICHLNFYNNFLRKYRTQLILCLYYKDIFCNLEVRIFHSHHTGLKNIHHLSILYI